MLFLAIRPKEKDVVKLTEIGFKPAPAGDMYLNITDGELDFKKIKCDIVLYNVNRPKFVKLVSKKKIKIKNNKLID
ncbi:MAG: hypothetical protein QXV17_01405 [Candidatus Micrarchaeaceae archaeon]